MQKHDLFENKNKYGFPILNIINIIVQPVNTVGTAPAAIPFLRCSFLDLIPDEGTTVTTRHNGSRIGWFISHLTGCDYGQLWLPMVNNG